MSSICYDSVEALKTRIREEFTAPHCCDNDLEILRLVMREDQKDTELLKMQRLSLGVKNSRANKVILLVGATGGGKTMLINTIVNYIFGVNFRDPFRFILIDYKNAPKRSQAESQTDLITAYTFNHLPGMPFEYNYILIDTPGIGDTRGIQRDREMVEQMRTFFESDYGVSQVDCIGLVVPSPESRLTQTQCYVFDSLSSMFGKDVKNKVFVMATFSDGQTPAVTEALEDANVTYEGMYKFNNSSLFASNSGSDPAVDINRHIWSMNTKSMTDFFSKLSTTFPVSLQLTKEVLRSRSQLQSYLIDLGTLLHICLDKMVTLENEKVMLFHIEADVKDCENYESEIEVPQIRMNRNDRSSRNYFSLSIFDLSTLVKSIIGIVGIFVRSAKMVLSAFSSFVGCSSGKKAEPLRLDINYVREKQGPDFSLEDYGYVYVKEKRTIKQLMDRYKIALKDKMDKEQVINALENDIRYIRLRLLQLIALAQALEQMLKNIALKQDSFSTKDYIDLMIQTEKNQRSLRWENRVEILTKLGKDTEALEDVSGGGIGSIGPKFADELVELGDRLFPPAA